MSLIGRLNTNPTTTYIVTGTISDDHTVALDKALPIKEGKVRLVVGLLVALILVAPAPLWPGEIENGPTPFLLKWGKPGTGQGEFDFPIGVAVNEIDEVVVADFYNNRIQRFTADGKFLDEFPTAPFPGGIAIDGEGNLYVAHFGLAPATKRNPPDGKRFRDQIAVYSPKGKLLRQWGKTGKGDGEFNQPGHIALSKDGKVYVSDQLNRRIQVFDTEGKFLFKWGQQGAKPGEFGASAHPLQFIGGPTFLALDRHGNLYVTEAKECRVQKFSADGTPLLLWGKAGNGPGEFGGPFSGYKGREPVVGFHGPMGICVDKQDRVWVVAMSGRIQQFSDKGNFIRGFGGEGTRPGECYAPHGMCIDRHGRLYIADSFNHRVQKFDVSR